MIGFRRRTPRRAWFALIAVAMVAFLVWQFVAYQIALTKMPPGWTVAGAAVTGLAYEDAVQQVQTTLTQQPIRLIYRDQTILLQPDEVGVVFSPTLTLEAIVRARSAAAGSQGLVTYIIRRAPPPQNIPAAVTWSDEKLRTFLAQIADRYDLSPQEPTAILDGLRMAPGRPGYELDVSASMPEVTAALTSAASRQVNLTIKDLPPPPPKLSALEALIRASLQSFDGIAGVFVKDLSSGQEYGFNQDVAFSGMGILKIAVMLEDYRRHMHIPADDVQWIEQMLADERGNGAANALLQKIGDGDAEAGARDRLTPSMRYLGLVNTFMVTPYDQPPTTIAVVTLANSRLDISTIPNPNMQTTPRDAALLLEMIHACSRGHGALMVAYPNSFTPDECNQMLDLMSRVALTDSSGAPAYLAGGLPAGVRLARKYSWLGNARADAGIVFLGGRAYALAVFLYVPNGGDWQQVNPVFKNVSQAAYNFFAVDQASSK